jgi:hypothetical protein
VSVSYPGETIIVWSKKVNKRREGGERKKNLGNGATDGGQNF